MNRIFEMGCLEGIRLLDSDSFDIILCDPPYNIGKDFGNNRDRMPMDAYLGWLGRIMDECLRVLKGSGTMFLYGLPETLGQFAAMRQNRNCRMLAWHYANKNVPSLNFWQRSHEAILCVWKGHPIFNRDSIREPYSEIFVKNCAGKPRPIVPGRFGKGASEYRAHEKGALPRDVIKIPALAGGAGFSERIILCRDCGLIVAPRDKKRHEGHRLIIHPTQKPMALAEKLILSCRPKGEFRALIPFCGSGSECAAVLKNKGRFTAFELNPEYVLLAQAFLRSACHMPGAAP